MLPVPFNIVVLSYVIYDICDVNKDLMFETCKFSFLHEEDGGLFQPICNDDSHIHVDFVLLSLNKMAKVAALINDDLHVYYECIFTW